MTSDELKFTDDEIDVLNEALTILMRRATATGMINDSHLNGAIEYLARDYDLAEARACKECATSCSITCYSSCKGDCANTCKGDASLHPGD